MDTSTLRRALTPLSVLKNLFVLGMFAAGAFLYDRLPDPVPSHWGLTGAADGFTPKPWGVWLIPLVALAMVVLFPIFKRIDPKRENYEAFARIWELMQLSFVAFMAYIYAMQLYLSFNPLPSPDFVGRFVTFGIGILFVILGNYMGKIRQNFFVGLRTPWSLSDPEVWNRSQRFGGWAFVLGGLAAMANAWLWWNGPILFFAIVIFIAIVPIVYSYLVFRERKEGKSGTGMKSFTLLILFCLFVIACVVVVMRLTGSEDTWICSQGQWVKHGNPSIAIPTSPCP
ncbi:MAG: SdpI family protein [Candidatus Peribacteraceae bacterium]|jgi:uncharacterized membrane protein